MNGKKRTSKRNTPDLHFPAGLLYLGSCFPHGLKTMLFLATHSPDERVRCVVEQWQKLNPEQQAETELEDVCFEVGIRPQDFLADTLGTAWELRINVAGVIDGITRMPYRVLACLATAAQSDEGVARAARAIAFIDKSVRRR